jgi:phage shock protein PspC (stress-responsive transcriptional regulator)
MQTVIQISLSGHSTAFQLDEDAHRSLLAYLERARSRLKRDPDRDEILCDLEQSIGDKFVTLLAGEKRIVSRKEIDSILEQIGSVEAGNGDSAAAAAQPDRPRRLCRIEEGKWLFGVCQGLAAYSSISVEWVRSIFIIVSIFTGGVPILIYFILALALPVVQTSDEYHADLRSQSRAT